MPDMSHNPAVVGRIVIVPVTINNNGAEVAPAIITRVWHDDPERGYALVNLRVFRDYSSADDRGVDWVTSVELYQEKPSKIGHVAWFPGRG